MSLLSALAPGPGPAPARASVAPSQSVACGVYDGNLDGVSAPAGRECKGAQTHPASQAAGFPCWPLLMCDTGPPAQEPMATRLSFVPQHLHGLRILVPETQESVGAVKKPAWREGKPG